MLFLVLRSERHALFDGVLDGFLVLLVLDGRLGLNLGRRPGARRLVLFVAAFVFWLLGHWGSPSCTLPSIKTPPA